jgi:lipoyl(octanoyl) transferase
MQVESPAHSPLPLVLRWRGVEAYAASFDAMRAFTDQRDERTPDELWLVEHPPVYTLGLAGDPAHLLDPNSTIALVKVDRGGQITYHGPGQVVAYLLLNLRRRGLMVRELVRRIEQAVIDTLAAYNLPGERQAGAPGIYLTPGFSVVDATGAAASPHADPRRPAADAHGRIAYGGAKIAALGLKIRKGCSYHGVSLNVNMDLRPFGQINPCGYAGLQTVDFASLGVRAGWHEVARTLAQQLAVQFCGSTEALQEAAAAEPA